MLECSIVLGVMVALAYLLMRLASLNLSHQTELEAKVDELLLLGFNDVGIDDLDVFCFRIIGITAQGYEDHTLLEACENKEGYKCYHYDPNGKLVGEKYVLFK